MPWNQSAPQQVVEGHGVQSLGGAVVVVHDQRGPSKLQQVVDDEHDQSKSQLVVEITVSKALVGPLHLGGPLPNRRSGWGVPKIEQVADA